MKFLLTIFVIYLIGVDANRKVKRSKAEKALQRDGFRSLTDAGRNFIQSNDHGNIARSPSKYGHFGLNVESSTGDRGNLPDATNAEQNARNTSAEAKSFGLDVGSKVKRSSDNEVHQTRGQLVQIISQGSQVPAPLNSFQPQFYNVGQSASYYGSESSQGGLYGPLSRLGNVQTQSSSYGPRGSNPYYEAALGQGSQSGTPYGQSVQGQYPIGQPVGSSIFASAPYPDGQVGALFQQGNNQGQYSNPGQPPGFPGFGIGVGQAPYDQNNIQAPQFTAIGPLTNQYGAVTSGQGAYRQNLFPMQFANGGQPTTGYYGSVTGTNNLWPQNGHLGLPYQLGQNGQSGVQGPYPGVGQPTNYYGTTPDNIQGQQRAQQGYLWPPYLGTPGAPGQIVGQLPALGSPTQPQFGLNTQNQQYVPGLYGSVENAVKFNAFGAVDPTIHALSRYINTGFYYPPPQHLNSNPNMWDPAARYFFTLNGQELPKDAASSSAPSNGFPITFSHT